MSLLRTIRTLWQLAARVNELQQRVEDVELEWVDKKDAFELLLKRLATRDARRRADGDGELVDLPAPATAGPAAGLDKAALRRFARDRGMIR